jgi:hypothetical protein
MMKRILSIAAGAILLGACEADRSEVSLTQPSSLRSSNASVADAPPLCTACALGPEVFVRDGGPPVTETIHFSASASSYVIDLDNLGSQGAAADVSLNGTYLMRDGRPGHVNEVVTLAAENTLVVRLMGKPGSQLRVAVWRFKPATLDAVTLDPGSVKLDGSSVTFNSTITNHTGAPITGVVVDMSVIQNATRKSWGASEVACGLDLGTLSIAPCITGGTYHEPTLEVGDGTLLPGDALAVIRLVRGAGNVLDSIVVPIILPSPAPAVLRVSITPPRLMLLPNTVAQLTANIQTVGGAPKTVTWSVTGLPVVTVSPSGLVTAVGMGFAPGGSSIEAVSMADPTKRSSIQVNVYDWRLSTPSVPVEIATGAPSSHPTSIDLQASVCGDFGMLALNPFTRVDFSALSNGAPVFIGTGTVSSSETFGPGGFHGICWNWRLTWTPGAGFGLGQQTVYATAFGSPTGTPPLATLPNTSITTVVP